MTDYKKRVWAEIDLDAIENNLNTIKSLAKTSEIIAVIKADGYGHGAVEIGRHLQALGVSFFAVSCIREAMELRRSGINSKILVLGYTDPEEANILADNNISQAVVSLEYATALSKRLTECGKKLNVHIKLNTGMNRLGFNCCNSLPIAEIKQALGLEGIEFEGLFTHFATSDRDGDESGEFTNTQFIRFINVCDELSNLGLAPKYRHCCNSAATLLEPTKQLDAVRTGIILYGLTPSSNLKLPAKLYPAMSFKSVVCMVHTLKEGEGVSYGITFKADKQMTLATVAVGYADGYPRYLSNCGEVLIGGKRCKIVGRVCMDQLVVDVSHLECVKSGDEVILIGKSGNQEITAEEIAKLGNTINYEIVCGISRRVPRYYIKGGKITAISDYLS